MDTQDTGVLDEVVTYGLVLRAPMFVANEIKAVLKRYEESIPFKYDAYSSGKLRLVPWTDDDQQR